MVGLRAAALEIDSEAGIAEVMAFSASQHLSLTASRKAHTTTKQIGYVKLQFIPNIRENLGVPCDFKDMPQPQCL